MDWLFLWALLSGSRDRYVLIETPEQREQREQREAEARARMIAAVVRSLQGGFGMIALMIFMWLSLPMAMWVLMGGDACQATDIPPAADALFRFMMRCN